jgi:hypothetical protein
MSTIRPTSRADFRTAQPDGEKHIPHIAHETREVWQILYAWAGTNERRWQMLVVMALLESAEWTQQAVAAALSLSQGRISQIAADAKDEIPQAFAPSPRDLAEAVA